MAESYNALAVNDLCDQIEAYTGDTTVGAALVHVKHGVRRVLAGLDPQSGIVHDWSFLHILAVLNIGGAVTGTGTSVSGTLTATTAIFNPSMVGLTITIANTTTITTTITAYTSSTVVTLDDTTSFSAKALSIAASGIVSLPDDFGGLPSPVVYVYAEDGETTIPVQAVSERTIYEHWRDDETPDEPYYYCLVASPFVGGTGQRWRLLFAPVPDEARQLLIPYDFLLPDITDAAVYLPGGGPAMDYCWAEAAFARAELITGRTVGVHEMMFQKAMAAAIEHDDRQKKIHVQRFIGRSS